MRGDDSLHMRAGATALMAAAGKGHLEDAAALLTAGADPLLKSSDGSTARDWATRFGHDDLADFLATHMQVQMRCWHAFQ
jgi:ankyrin repeat protein